jgi:hypothetical protein
VCPRPATSWLRSDRYSHPPRSPKAAVVDKGPAGEPAVGNLGDDAMNDLGAWGVTPWLAAAESEARAAQAAQQQAAGKPQAAKAPNAHLLVSCLRRGEVVKQRVGTLF